MSSTIAIAPTSEGTRERSHRRKVAFLGPFASYSHQATKSAFPNKDEWELIPTTTIREVFDEVQASNVDFGVAPFENSTHGTVSFTLDCLADRASTYPNIIICGEAYLDVHHFLLGRRKASLLPNVNVETAKATPLTSLSHVKRVYSHPQAFGQTAKFFATYLKAVETIEVSSTSKAAELAAADASGESAAVAGEVAGEMVGLDVLARCIEDREDNTTRFFVLRRRPCSSRSDDGVEQEVSLPEGLPWTTDRAESLPGSSSGSGGSPVSMSPRPSSSVSGSNGGRDDAEKGDAYKGLYKSMVSFTVPHHTPGALADVLGSFKRRGLNLTSINSLPSLIAPFQYLFFVEFEGNRWDDPEGRVSGLVGDVEWVEGVAERWRGLGSWLNQRRR
ncbi:Prephenate dehydratase-domain-containing protein [Pseudoneurospora amorphoporcata]|uniref:prephenate dehydratase n=1 Tax=Pseudoneurospora amorphoporcata TaxID=241081 RepID=A0AAN6NVB0_9PEZI|nr:Prephenate dehydratase-domain-containing protein [Pseudoneurospora amorphoporcata]